MRVLFLPYFNCLFQLELDGDHIILCRSNFLTVYSFEAYSQIIWESVI